MLISTIPDNLSDFIEKVQMYQPKQGDETEILNQIEGPWSSNAFSLIIDHHLENNKKWMRIAVCKVPWIMKMLHFDRFPGYEFDYESAVLAGALDSRNHMFSYLISGIGSEFPELKERYINDVLKLNGCALEFIRSEEQTKHYVGIAVLQNGHALKYATEELKDNDEIVKLALANNIRSYEFVSERLKQNRDLALQVVKQDGICIKYVNENFRNTDKEIILMAVSSNEHAISYLPIHLREDSEIIQTAISHNPRAIQYISKKSRQKLNL